MPKNPKVGRCNSCKNLKDLAGDPQEGGHCSRGEGTRFGGISIHNQRKENPSVKKFVSLFVAFAFVTGMVGFAAAQTTAPATDKAAEKTEKAPKAEKAKAAKTKLARGKVKSASADSIVVAGAKDKEYTFAVDDKTSIKKGGKKAAAADLQADDQVTVRYTEADGKMVAKSVVAKAAKKAAAGEAKTEKKEEKK